MFKGSVQKGLSGHVVCWETDHSNSGWYDKLTRAMEEIAKTSNAMSVTVGNDVWDELIGPTGLISQVNEVLMWIENIATLVAALLDLF